MDPTLTPSASPRRSPTGSRPRRAHPAAGGRRFTLIASIAAALGLTAWLGVGTAVVQAAEDNAEPEDLPSATSPPRPTTVATRPRSTPTSAPRVTTTTTRPKAENRRPPSTRTKES